MLNDVLEVLGFLLVVAFCLVVWWPSALLVGGVLLIVTATVRSTAKPAKPADSEGTP